MCNCTHTNDIDEATSAKIKNASPVCETWRQVKLYDFSELSFIAQQIVIYNEIYLLNFPRSRQVSQTLRNTFSRTREKYCPRRIFG